MEQQSPIKKTSIPGLLVIQRPTNSDDRGFFRESARIKEIEEASGIGFAVAQMNHARSSKNTLRGIHIAPWNKLIYVPRGKVQAVIVDLREDSAVFGKYESFILGDENRSSLFVPHGCGNSYLVLNEVADYVYLTDMEFEPNKEKSIIWNDPTLNIVWQLEGEPVLSERDQKTPNLKSVFPNKF